MYRYVDAALVRAAAYPSGQVFPPPPEVSGLPELDQQRWLDWIRQVWAQEPLAEAVELASPVLARRVLKLCTGGACRFKQVRRTGAALHRYLLRMQHRSTPFGLFAGIAPARIGTGLLVRWGEGHRLVPRVDALWMAEVVTRLEESPDLLGRLPVMADSTCFVRGGRLVVPCQRPAHNQQRGPGEVGVRHTGAVQTVVAAASSPTVAGELAGRLAAAYPDTPTDTIEALLAELVTHRILLTSLRPPMTDTNPLDHVIEQLSAVDAENIAAVAPTVDALRQIQAMLARHTDAAPETKRRLRADIATAMRAQASIVEQPLAVDLRLDCSLTLPQQVAGEAEKAVSALARLTPYPAGSPAWQDYHDRFLDRYGPGATIPVLHLTDPDTGLDLPAGYRGSLLPRPAPGLTRRDERLLALAQRAACEGASEVTLTEALLAELEHGQGQPPLPHLDVRFRLHAPARSAVNRGEFTLVVTGLTPAAGATAGRFLDLLDTTDRDRMTATYTSLPTLDSDAVRAQVSSPPLRVRTENVGRAPALWRDLVSVAEYRSDRALRLVDLAVTADATRLWLVSLMTGQPIEPIMLNAVDLANFTHPLARFLCELPRARAAAVGPFTWGAAGRLPFLPRIRYGRTVLAPATWRIETTDLPGRDASHGEWRLSLTVWQKRFAVPDAVEVGDDDQCLRLNLDHTGDAALLRAELDRAGHVRVREAPETTAYGWFDGRPHEITLAVASTRTPVPSRGHNPAVRPVLVGGEHGHLPGASPWAFLKLYGHPDRVPEILTGHLPRLWDGWDGPPEWWFIRYRDPHAHLRLRFRLPHPGAFGDVAARVGTWAANLRQHGLLSHTQWDTYYAETGRYGTGAAMAAAETVFAADSAAALAQMRFTASGKPHPQAVLAASIVDLAAGFAGDVGVGMRWLIDNIAADASGHPTRKVHQEAMRLANPRDGLAALRDLADGNKVTAAWAARCEALKSYHALLLAGSQPRPEAVLPSLMHMHHLRATGVDRANENVCLRLARSAALAWAARDRGAAT